MDKIKIPPKARTETEWSMIRVRADHAKKLSSIAKRTKRSMGEIVGILLEKAE